MCTVTWRFTPDSGGWALDLGFNRDERRDRPRAQPPRVRRPEAGLPFIAPRDPAGDGTHVGSENIRGETEEEKQRKGE